MHLFFVLGCTDGYQDNFRSSNYCFKRVNDKKTWEDAKNDCSRDNGHLACTEIIMLSNKCQDCWLGYFWENGKFNTNDSMCKFLLIRIYK